MNMQQQGGHVNMYLHPDPAATPPPSAQTLMHYQQPGPDGHAGTPFQGAIPGHPGTMPGQQQQQANYPLQPGLVNQAGMQFGGTQAGMQLPGNQAGMQGTNAGLHGNAYIGPGNSTQYIQQQYKVGIFYTSHKWLCMVDIA